eukprot:CAMPEP_0180479810 /NCGR_PEP_ID=MMETSP1036_2-20121128/33493_1 /TAXON_ID=632150 /ORGANISM="Azadinium spinosum, Strain 3D9" /LENGTH=55 /DNA_ID=CAMNT_0022487387 /DNA_START=204 /DNA_END=371 /DNA_ORIENTATION=-
MKSILSIVAIAHGTPKQPNTGFNGAGAYNLMTSSAAASFIAFFAFFMASMSRNTK